jgi:hypothetical protein
MEYGVEPHEVLQAPPLTEIRGGLTRGDKGVAVELNRIRQAQAWREELEPIL